MRPEITRWIEQSKEEFDTAQSSYKNQKWFAVAFWCQQSVEKIFKALLILKKKQSPGTSHSLTFLGREIGIPKQHWNALRDLTKEYYLSRYPDATEDVPYKTYTKEDAERFLKEAEEVIRWAQSQIKK